MESTIKVFEDHPNDTQVCKEAVQESINKVQLAHKFMRNSASGCEKVLSAHMCTLDPVRAQVGEGSTISKASVEGRRVFVEQMISEIQV